MFWRISITVIWRLRPRVFPILIGLASVTRSKQVSDMKARMECIVAEFHNCTVARDDALAVGLSMLPDFEFDAFGVARCYGPDHTRRSVPVDFGWEMLKLGLKFSRICRKPAFRWDAPDFELNCSQAILWTPCSWKEPWEIRRFACFGLNLYRCCQFNLFYINKF